MPKSVVKQTPYARIRIKSRRLILRPFLFSDYTICKASHQKRMPKIHEFDEELLIANSKTYAQFKKRIEKYRETGRKKVHFVLGIFEQRSGDLAGQVDLYLLNKKLRWANLGYQIQNQYWGKGYAPEACTCVLKYAFKELHIHRIEASMDVENHASFRVAEKIGMVQEGTRRNFFPDENINVLNVFAMNAIDAERR
jgi:RimJ/RimL family protein N-acetyltransferase